MAVVVLPSLLAAEAGGQKRFDVEAQTVGEALRALPVANLLLDEHGDVRPLVNLYVDGQPADAETALGNELRVVAAVAGGSK